MTIHSRIKQRREALGMSMQTLADLVGVSAWQTIQQWEKEGGTAPKRERLAAVANALQTTQEYLLLGNGDMDEDGTVDLGGERMQRPSTRALQIARRFEQLDAAAQEAILGLLDAFEKRKG